jgi:hypothetical protein
MKPESLQALIIDRHFGELSLEAEELLEMHLAQDASARAEAERLLEAMAVTRETVMGHPELARVTLASAPEARPRQGFFAINARLLVRAAAVMLLGAVAGAAGFVAGRSDKQREAAATRPLPATMVAQTAPPKSGPWAQYRMSLDPGGEGMQVVRVDMANLEKQSKR